MEVSWLYFENLVISSINIFEFFFVSSGKCATIRTNGIGTFECKCKVGYFGRLCESKKATEFILNDTFVNTPFTSELALAKNALHFSGAWPRFVFFCEWFTSYSTVVCYKWGVKQYFASSKLSRAWVTRPWKF